MKLFAIPLTTLLLLSAGCSFDLDAISAPGTDSALPDMNTTDLAPLDSALPDMAAADSAQPDLAAADLAKVDLSEPDGIKGDLSQPDGPTPDMSKPDQTAPDLTSPDAGPPVKDPTGIAVSAKTGNDWQVTVASHGAGFMALWAAGGDIFGSTMASAASGKFSAPFTLSSATGTLAYPALSFAGPDYVAVWEHPNPTNAHIRGSLVTTAGGVKSPGGMNISDASANQVQPAVACSSSQCLVVWQDGRNNASATGYDIYGRRFDPVLGTLLDNKDRAITNATDGQQIPDVAFDGKDFLVTWMDSRAAKDDAYGARVSSAGAVLDTAGIQFSRSTTAETRRYTNVACDGAGGCLVAWMDGASSTTSKIQIKGVITQSSAGQIKVISTTDIVISNPAINAWFPDVAYSGGDYLVVWQNGDSPSGNIAGVRVSKAGKVTTTPLLDISLASGHQASPAVARGANQFLVTWDDKRNGTDLDVYAARVGP